MMTVVLVVGSGSLTNNRIESQIASHDTKARQALLAAEYALTLGESTVEQALDESYINQSQANLPKGFYGQNLQPPWHKCTWDDRDSVDVSTYFADPVTRIPATLPPLPPALHNAL